MARVHHNVPVNNVRAIRVGIAIFVILPPHDCVFVCVGEETL